MKYQKIRLYMALVFGFFLLLPDAAWGLKPWETGGMETRQYRNIFVEAGYAPEAVDARLKEIFHGVFEGPDKVYFEVGDEMAYISDIKNKDVRTEGMSYGMMIAVQFDRQDIFDRLWRWAVKYMQQQEGPYEGYFAWSCKTDGTRNAQGPASDGELYYVTALIFASNLWGNQGDINYLAEAQHILNIATNKSQQSRVTNLIHPEHKLITFVPDRGGNQFTDPSYHLPVFYEIWARWAYDGRADFWRECAAESRKYLHKATHPVTGLNPDYSNYDGTPYGRGRLIGEAFRFDSWRVPMNIAIDYAWACADKEWQQGYGERIQNFLYSQGVETFVDQYNIDGTQVEQILGAGGYKALRHSLGLVATSAAVSLVCSHDKSKEFIDHFWNSRHVPYEDGYFDAYYDGLLQLFSFMLMSGNYRIIHPVEDGHQLWLRGETAAGAKVTANKKSPTINIAKEELENGWKGGEVRLRLQNSKELRALGRDGFRIAGNSQQVDIMASAEQGLLYGAYHLLRMQETGKITENIQVEEKPAFDIRILNHWDNLNRTVERGYAGYSLWRWDQLPEVVSPRYEAYARANASIGINATVLNNVNASPDILKAEYLQKVKVLADIFRPYGIKVYLSINFSSPKILGGLEDSDPLNPAVPLWWKEKVKEIYKLIPDFGGFLVKANSEGQPGPQDYGRTHVDGANMLADALKPYKGIVMWRAFVYAPDEPDRAKQAYAEFMPFDGEFRDNVIIQVKNGPVDFQPREPFSPLFGAMQKTPVMAELQITQEYLGFSNHLAYLSTMWEEFLKSDTYSKGEGSTVAKATDGSLFNHSLSAISGVANIGVDDNWCGHHFAQANWYAFGRLAWNHELTSEAIADEWIRMTFSSDPEFLVPVKKMMLDSREAVVNYMMPLGLHHIFAEGHHYGPQPWYSQAAREDWTCVYYHKASKEAIGFDRTTKGSNAVAQYFSPLREQFNNPATCPDEYLLWFHHLPWDFKMKDGKTLWDALCYKYDKGVQQAREFQKIWDKAGSLIDEHRFQHVQSRLKIQASDAVWWKDACLLYFQTFSNKPIPYDIERPVHELNDLKKIRLNMRHTN
nr:glycosyl hydrolase family 8 [Parabacteroides sp. PFB2-10]